MKTWLEKEHIEHGNLKALVCTLHHYVELFIGFTFPLRHAYRPKVLFQFCGSYVIPTDNSFYNRRSDVILQTIVLQTDTRV